MNLAKTPAEIISDIANSLTRTQAAGLNALIFLSLREETSIAYQHKEWGFLDIPGFIVAWCDYLDEDDLLELVTEIISTTLSDELVTNLRGTENGEIATASREEKSAQITAAQAFEPNPTPSLLSAYSDYPAVID
ncbi:MAG: hypothetical protein RMY62_008465 [Nostoc sp. ZfuVER08]|nr:hypothetical protein [Nostoc sp. ZfuVER08]